METVKAKSAWVVNYTPHNFIKISEEYDKTRLAELNDHLAKGDFALISSRRAFEGFWLIDFPLHQEPPYRAVILLDE